MLAKRKILISAFLSLSTLTTITMADGLNCSNGQCHINVKNFNASKNMPTNTRRFKNIRQHKFVQQNDTNELQIEDKNPNQLETFRLEHKKYIKQINEILIPLNAEEELNTVIPAPEKFVATPQEKELYYEQQRNMGIEELIEPSLPMSLYYCMNNTEPVYDEQAEQFNCLISS